MSLPITQRAIRIHKPGGTEVVQFETDVPLPEFSDTQILVKVKYAGVNFVDTYFRSGKVPSKLPFTLGLEGSGQVVAIGSKVTSFAVGDKVGFIDFGSFAEYVTIEDSARVAKLPEGVSYKDAAATFAQSLTALSFVKEGYEVKENDTILIHAAAGGTGSQLVQFAKQAGATVIGTTSSLAKAEQVEALGADYVINYKTEDVVKRVKEITNNEGVNAVYDGVGKDTFDISFKALKRKGTLVCFGNASGPVPQFDISRLTEKNNRLTRPSFFNYVVTPEEWKFYTDRLFKLIQGHKLKFDVTRVYPLKETGQALSDLESGKTTGKLLIEIN